MNVTAEQIVTRIKLVCDGVDLKWLQVSQYLSFFRRQVWLTEVLMELLVKKQLNVLDRDFEREALWQ